jgi:hypothetical protein
MEALVTLHSIVRWLVLIALISSVVIAFRNRGSASWAPDALKPFSWTAIVFDIQVTIGLITYITHKSWGDNVFIAAIHPVFMLAALGFFHMNVAKARKTASPAAYKSLLVGSVVSLVLVLVAIPWVAST